MLHVLMDYDNVAADKDLPEALGPAIEHIVSRCLVGVKDDDRAVCDRVEVRLYGGWYEDSTLTQRAQALTAYVQQAYPAHLRRVNGPTARVSVELAVSLVADRTVHLLHTYRRRQTLYGVRVEDPLKVGCIAEKCSVKGVKSLVKKGRCPDCGTPATSILWRTEQKLVDVMLAVDVLELCRSAENVVVVVSSDEDLWPALLYVTQAERRIYHMQGKTGRALRPEYAKHAGRAYCEIAYDVGGTDDSSGIA